MRRKYLLLALVALALSGCKCDKKHFAPAPLQPPTNLTATAVNCHHIHLTWEDNCEDEDYYRVLCPTMWGIQNQTIATLPANTTSFDHHTHVEPEKEYEYYVGVHRGEEYARSEAVFVTTPPCD